MKALRFFWLFAQRAGLLIPQRRTTARVVGLLLAGGLVCCACSPQPAVVATPLPAARAMTPASAPSAALPPPLTAAPISPPASSTPPPLATQPPSASATPSAAPLQAGATRIAAIDNAPLVYIPAGAFRMGSSSEDREALPDETPQRLVSLPAFWIDQMEVSNVQYAACVQAGACRPPYYSSSSTRVSYYGDTRFAQYPVILVGWAMADAYCRWAGRRLPSEAEWEKAARGNDGRIYPWGSQLSGERANFCDQRCPFSWKDPRYDDGYADTAPVNAYPAGASPYGVLNMAGNVWEWSADWYGEVPGSPPASGKYRVLKGGTWFYEPRRIRAAARGKADPGYMSNLIGFRCAADEPSNSSQVAP